MTPHTFAKTLRLLLCSLRTTDTDEAKLAKIDAFARQRGVHRHLGKHPTHKP